MSKPNDPIDNIEWRYVQDLKANNYNPNVVFTPELKLLKHSILTRGWCAAITINPNGIIIDGFHRWMLAQENEIFAKYRGQVPCIVIKCTDAEAMMLTVQMNRAKGTHVAVRMSELVQSLVDDYGVSFEDIGEGIGAKKEEVKLLYDGDVFKHRDLKNYKYSKAWIPAEVNDEERQKMIANGDKGIMPERDDDLAPDDIS